MDVLQLLRLDHDRIRELINSLHRSENPKLHQLLFNQMRFDLARHALLEVNHFYPIIERIGALQPMVLRFRQQHARIQRLLDQASGLPEGSVEIPRRMKDLVLYVEAHLIEEEEHLFAAVRETMDPAERMRLGTRLKSISGQLAA